ncbi:MAG: L,D-transpeptidase [Clostridia bacterium]|nr:L,D-transpeptidase [Clostridia bacterium]
MKKKNMVKRLFAVLLTLGMVMSSVVFSGALSLTDLFPRGSNPPVTEPEEGEGNTGLGKVIETLFTPTAPDQVLEAFGVYADEEYIKTHEYCFAVNTSQNIVIAYTIGVDGVYSKPVKALVCSCGLESSPTKKGIFKTTDRYQWRALNGGVYGKWATRITGPYLFHSVPYEKQSSSTLETAEYNKLGQNASAGCVRLACHDAKWVYNRCPEGTIVYIYDDSDVKEPLAKPTPQRIDPTSPYAGWDPTDDNSNNPWKS